MCTDVGGRLIPALELMGNIFNRGVMTMFLMQKREAQPQVCAEFRSQQVFLPHKYAEYYILMLFIQTPTEGPTPLASRIGIF
jgi:hypothetical protein